MESSRPRWMRRGWLSWLLAEVVLEPLLRQVAMKSAQALMGSIALVITYVGLLVTDLFSDGLQITGLSTWVLATIIVWLAALLAELLAPPDPGEAGSAGPQERPGKLLTDWSPWSA